jgi:hypothetical protein
MKFSNTFLIVVAVLFLAAPPSAAADIHVNPGDNIQDIINSAEDGDRILVHAGTYNQQITIDGFKSLQIIGDGIDQTILDGTGLLTGDMVTITNSNNIVFKKFTVRDGPDHGILVSEIENVKIIRNKIDNNGQYGLSYEEGLELQIKNCQIFRNGDGGIEMDDYSNYTVIKGNRVELNQNYGIWHGYGNNDLIADNKILDNGSEGIYTDGGYALKVLRNEVKRNGSYGIVMNSWGGFKDKCADNIVEDNGDDGIYASMAVRIIRNRVSSNTSYGIYSKYNGSIILSNIVTLNESDGIHQGLDADVHIENNFVDKNQGYGILFEGGSATLIDNTVTGNDLSGIYLNEDVSVMKNNFVDGNGVYGIKVDRANILTNNTFTNNLSWGLYSDLYNNTVVGNLAVNNQDSGIGGGMEFSYLKKNTSKRNKGSGIDDFTSSIVKSNTVKKNSMNGIDATGSGNIESLIKSNIVTGNGNGLTTFDLMDSVPPDDRWKKNRYNTRNW